MTSPFNPACCACIVYSYGSAGAVWDVWASDDAPTLRSYLDAHLTDFVHHGQQLSRDIVSVGSVGSGCGLHLRHADLQIDGCQGTAPASM